VGSLDFVRLPEMSDVEIIEHLTQVKGVGVWTAQMFLMFALKRENVLPTGDFGVRMAMFKLYLDKKRKIVGGAGNGKAATKKVRARKIKLPNPQQMEKIAKSWEPYRSVACWYLWRSLDIKTL
jgi:DNA-3-methyladenine glycosylase II